MRATEHRHSPTPEDIMEYLDGEGTVVSRRDLAAHLATCAECQEVAAEQRTISERARAWTVPPAPASMQTPPAPGDRIAAVRGLRPARWMLVGLPAAAALVIVVSLNQGRRDVPTAKAIEAIAQTDQSVRKAMPAREAPAPASGPVSEMAPALQRLRQGPGQTSTGPQVARTPSIIRTALLQIVVKDFGAARGSIEALVGQTNGFIDHMTVTGDTSEVRTLRGTLRVPGDRMMDTLTRLRGLGQVTEDTQGSQDVTDQIVDLDARLASGRATEQRLTELLRHRTGRLSDVLEVERELTRVRLDIERLDAEKANLDRRVSYATIDLTIREERKASLDGPLTLATRIRIAAGDGLEAALDSVAATILLALRAGPTLIFWGGIVALGWLALRRIGFGIRDSR